MSTRIPSLSDFPPNLTLTITSPPPSQKPVNILILLHGLGDTHLPFKQLGEQLNLPETACIALQSPNPLPFDMGGFHWGSDLIFDSSTGALDPDTGFKGSTKVLLDVLEVLTQECNYAMRNIIFFGFGQGGMAALRAALETQERAELGGVVSVGGPLPSDVGPKSPPKSRTPVLVLGGSSGSLVTQAAVERLKSEFEFVEYKMWRRPGDGMPRDRDEMMPIMQFFARRLRSLKGVPEGSVEIG